MLLVINFSCAKPTEDITKKVEKSLSVLVMFLKTVAVFILRIYSLQTRLLHSDTPMREVRSLTSSSKPSTCAEREKSQTLLTLLHTKSALCQTHPCRPFGAQHKENQNGRSAVFVSRSKNLVGEGTCPKLPTEGPTRRDQNFTVNQKGKVSRQRLSSRNKK